jgi:hypothetical protein
MVFVCFPADFPQSSERAGETGSYPTASTTKRIKVPRWTWRFLQARYCTLFKSFSPTGLVSGQAGAFVATALDLRLACSTPARLGNKDL